MKQLTTFLFGVTTGMYIAQNYDTPDVITEFNKLVTYLKKYEKNN